MTTNHEHLREVAERATPQDFDSAEIVAKDGWIECPCCSGEGSVELTADYCNYDNEALGVQFYGVGPAHVNAEEFYRTFNPATAIALLDELAALRKENEGLRVDAERYRWLRDIGVNDNGWHLTQELPNGMEEMHIFPKRMDQAIDSAMLENANG